MKNKKNLGSGLNYEKIIAEVAKMQIATQQVMPMVREQIQKGWKQIPNVDAKRSSKSWFFDPLSIQYALGYKDRNFSLTYDTIKRTVQQLSILSAIINLRCSQVAAFAQPYRSTRSLGYVIKHKDPDHPTTRAEVAFIKELEDFIQNCGRSEPNPYSNGKRDDLEDFLKKIVRDSLQFDAAVAEVVPDRMGIPYEFMAVDASTIRIASDDRFTSLNSNMTSRSGFNPTNAKQFNTQGTNEFGGSNFSGGRPTAYVQVINGQIENSYNSDELIYGVRNPRTDIYTQGYGYAEVEQLITIITGTLYAEEYNRSIFKNGSTPNGILNLKGDNWSEEQLEAFQRQWQSQVAGIENAHKVPVLNSEGLEWVDLTKTNQEMEFGKWIEYNIKIICGVFQCDPAEINFDLGGGVSQTPMFESSSEWKLKASKDRGLKPLLKFIAKLINKHIIDKIDDHFTFEFVGLDEMSEQDKHNMVLEQISSYLTLNEARRQLDLPDLPNGDVPMNPTYAQFLKMQQDNAMQQQQMQQDQAAQAAAPVDPAQGGQPAAPPTNAVPASYPEQPQTPPQYSATYGMSDFPFLDPQETQ